MPGKNRKNKSYTGILNRQNVLFALVPALLWGVATYARPFIIGTRCISQPQSCTKKSLLPIDQLSIGTEDWKADEYSYNTQNLSGVIAVAAPLAWTVSRVAIGGLVPASAAIVIAEDLLIFAQVSAWNGLFTELSHLVAQRPRPFVYINPAVRGTDSAHYTSFYSGHTSFTAAAAATTFFILLMRGAPLIILLLSLVNMEALVIMTSYFRIMAGRHFLTDVICGAIAGSLITWAIAQWHRKSKARPRFIS
jgi:membrane-associated phospholipid phosphatase